MSTEKLKSVFWQRKEKLLKKQHRQALLLDNFLSVDGLAPGRSLRDRKPVTYTFGENNLSILCIYIIMFIFQLLMTLLPF